MEVDAGLGEAEAGGEGVKMKVDSERGTGYKLRMEPDEHLAKAADQGRGMTRTTEYRRFHKMLKQVIEAPPLRKSSKQGH